MTGLNIQASTKRAYTVKSFFFNDYVNDILIQYLAESNFRLICVSKISNINYYCMQLKLDIHVTTIKIYMGY